MRHSRPAAAGALALLLLSACSGGDPPTGASAASTPPAPSTPSGSPGTPSPPPGDLTRGLPRPALVVVTAVEGGCVYAVDEARKEVLALRGQVPEVAVGDRLEVLGAPDDTAYEECPDGAPFLVSEIVPRD